MAKHDEKDVKHGAKNMTTATTATPAPTEKTSRAIRIDEIAITLDWNARNKDIITAPGNASVSTGDETHPDEGVTGIADSIRSRGQDTAIHVRLNPNKADAKKHPYALISGFKRIHAILRIAQETLAANETKSPIKGWPSWNPADPTIMAVVDEVDEADAILMNLAENTARSNLSAQDTAFGIRNYFQAYKKLHGKPPVVSTLAKELGMNQSYTNALVHINELENAPRGADILAHWRGATSPISVTIMTKEVVNGATDERKWEAYQALTKTKEAASNPDAPDPKAWLVKASEAAHALGKSIGILTFHKQLPEQDAGDIDWKGTLIDLIDVKKKHEPADIAVLAKSARDGYYAGLKEIPAREAKLANEKAEKAKAKADKADEPKPPKAPKAAKDGADAKNGSPEATPAN